MEKTKQGSNKTIVVTVELGSKNYSAYIEDLPGCIATGSTVSELETNMREAVSEHIALCTELGEKVPAVFKGKYDLAFKYEPMALLNQYTGIFTWAAMERITGISKKQFSHYATGHKTPRPAQRKKITDGLHRLGRELLQVEL